MLEENDSQVTAKLEDSVEKPAGEVPLASRKAKALNTKEFLKHPRKDKGAAKASKEALRWKINRQAQEDISPTSIRRTTFIESGKTEAEQAVYLHDKPLRKLAKQAAVTAAVAIIVLATVGFIMGLTGLRTPHISGDAIWNQWQTITGQDTTQEQWNELERNP